MSSIYKNELINPIDFVKCSKKWKKNKPFPHLILDNFLKTDVAKTLENEFPDFHDEVWHEYDNQIEVKKVCNNWNAFPRLTYKVINFLNSQEFVTNLSKFLLAKETLYSDSGLNGGGWHIHAKGGKLNTHLDYSIHPKLELQRKLNIIIYLNSKWNKKWGGSLGFWGNKSSDEPGMLEKEIMPKFNRAVIFDTTCNSWHGLPNKIMCPKNEFRKSIAVYYLCKAKPNVDKRGKALFSASKSQKNDPDILDLIKKRSDTNQAHKVYKK